MRGRRRARAARAWSVVFALTAAVAGGLPALLGPRSAGAQPVTIQAPAAAPDDLLRAGDLALSRRQYAQADAAYRKAWADPEARARAAAALRSLHRRADFKLPADESDVAAARSALGSRFIRYDTPHYVVLSDCPPDWTRARAALLERTRLEFFRAVDKLALAPVPHPTKLVCVFFNSHEDYRLFGRRDGLVADWVAGYYATAANRIVFYNDATSPAFAAARARLDQYDDQAARAREQAEHAGRARQDDLARQLHASADDLARRVRDERDRLDRQAAGFSTSKTIHECVHLLAFNTGVQRRDRDYPLWISEGLAGSFETDNPDIAFGPDRAPPAGPDSRRARAVALARAGALPPLGDLITVAAPARWDADTADAMYALSETLFAYLYRREPAALGAFIRALGNEAPGPLTQARAFQLFTDHFGDPVLIQRRIYLDLR